MKFQRVIDALYRTPLAILPAGFETLDVIFRSHVKGQRPETDVFGDPMEKMEIAGGTAIIPIFGPLLQHASLLDKQCGATSYDDIIEDLENAAGRGDVKQVVLNFNSPGGEVAGCLECAEFIAERQEETGIPCYAFTDSSCASAAYFLASSCDQVFASRSSIVGSIGCMIGFVDTSKAFEMEGLKAEYFTSGKYKAAGASGTALTDEQREHFQGLVDCAFGQFAEHVMSHREGIDLDAMQGQCFFGSDAVKPGVVDGAFDSLEALMDFLEP